MDIVTYVLAKNSANSAIATAIAAVNAQIAQNTTDIADLEADQYKAYVTDTASGSIASFADGADNIPVKDLTVAVEPVQDLHGYDNPWPAGGGKNLFDESTIYHGYYAPDIIDRMVLDEAYRTCVLTLPAGTYTFSCDMANIYILRYTIGEQNTSVTNEQSTVTFIVPSEAVVKICFRNTGTTAITGTFHTQIESGSTATSYTPYSNICPISGWTGANVTRTGKNLLNSNTITQNKVIDNTGAIVTNNAIEITDYIRVKPSTQYVLSGTLLNGNSSNADVRVNFYTADKTWKYRSGTNKTNELIFTTDADTYFVRFSFSKDSTDQMCEEGSTATPFVAYNGSTYSITFPSEAGTVYGGTLDVTNGKLTVNWAKIVLNGTQQISRENWKPQAKSVGWIYPYDLTRNIVGTGSALQNIKCDTLPSMPFNSLQSINGPGIALASNQTYGISVMYPNTTLTTASAINAFLAEHPIDVVYELATPIVYDLTPTEVATLLAQNNIWADCGDSTVNYFADTKLYIDKKIAARGGGGDDEFVVTFTKSAGMVRSADHTYAEIEAAIDAGKTVVAHVTFGGGYVEVYPIVTRGSNYTTQKQRILFATPLMPSASGSGDDGFSDVLMVEQNLIWIVSDGTMDSMSKHIRYA